MTFNLFAFYVQIAAHVLLAGIALVGLRFAGRLRQEQPRAALYMRIGCGALILYVIERMGTYVLIASPWFDVRTVDLIPASYLITQTLIVVALGSCALATFADRRRIGAQS
jgi:hypothetical protein